MSELPPTALVALTEAKHAIRADDSLEDQLRASPRATKDHWLVTNEGERFKAAVGAVMSFHGPESDAFKRLAWEVRQLDKISAMQQAALAGLSVDVGSLDFELGEYEPIGLLGMWRGL